MYYEERWIDGILYWRRRSKAKWELATSCMLNKKLREALAKLEELKEVIERKFL